MTQKKYRITVFLDIDDEEYPVPSDQAMELQLTEDITEAIQEAIDCRIQNVITKEV